MRRFDSLCDSGELTSDLFEINSLEDEIQVDHRCESLLRIFCQYQIDERGLRPEDAGAQARGADYLLREFIIGDRRENLVHIAPGRIRQFAGNWYITKAVEPNVKELGEILHGTGEFYDFLAGFGLVTAQQAAEIKNHCRDLDYYQQRIDSFWAIVGDGFTAWCDACPIEP
jgi:hypothetical protein